MDTIGHRYHPAVICDIFQSLVASLNFVCGRVRWRYLGGSFKFVAIGIDIRLQC